MASVSWTAQALDDLEAACLYLARDAPHVAGVFAASCFEATERLAAFPLSGRIVPEIGGREVREVFVFGYRLIYRSLGDQVVILTVHHGARTFPVGIG